MKKINAALANYLFLLILGFGIAFTVYKISSIYRKFAPDEPVRVVWDMADHGYRGVSITEDWEEFNLYSLLEDTVSQKLHPFVHSYILSFFFLCSGTTVKAASRASLIAFAGCGILIFYLGKEAGGKLKNLCGLAAFFLLITSPTYLLFSTLIMLEIWGAFFTLLGLLLFIKAISSDSEKLYIFSYLAATILFFTKYNYGIYLIITIFIAETGLLPLSSRKFIKREISSFFKFKNLLAFSNLALLLIIISFIAIIFTGGFEITLFGRKISFHHLQNPLYFLTALLVFKAVRYYKNNRGELAANLLRKHAGLILFIVIPILIWFLIPDNLEAFFSFARARPADVQRQGIKTLSLANLICYPKIILNYYCLSPPVFIFIIIFYIFSLLTFKKESKAIKTMHLYFLISFGLMILHPYKEARFIFVILPVLWVISVAKAVNFIIYPKLKRFVIPIFICGLIAYSPKFYSSAKNFYQNRLIPRTMIWFHPSPDLAPVIDCIVSETRTPYNVAIQGTFNELSPYLLRWNIFNAGSGKHREILFDLREEEILEKLKRYEVKKLISIKVSPASPFYSPDYVNYNVWKVSAIQSVEKERIFTMKREIYFRYAGIEVDVYN